MLCPRWSWDRVILAADSKATHSNGETSNVCKVRMEGNVYYAAAGLFSYEQTGFYLPELIHQASEAMKEPKSLFQLQMNLDETVNTALAKARDSVEESLKRNPNLNYGETIIVGFDHGKVRLIHSLSDISESHLETNQRGIQSFAFQTSEEVLPDDSPIPARAVVAGEKMAIFSYVAQHPEWVNTDPVQAARKFLELEIDDCPGTVGGPISIVAIEKDGSATWIERGVCTGSPLAK